MGSFTNQLKNKMKEYFENTTPEQVYQNLLVEKYHRCYDGWSVVGWYNERK